MTNGELMTLLIARAKKYQPLVLASVARNDHMNELEPGNQPTQQQAEAVLVDFINYVGLCSGMDMGLYTCDLAAHD